MRRVIAAVVGVGCLGLTVLGAKPLRPQRTPEEITRILAGGAHAGDCDACHTAHGRGEVVYEHALLGPNENSLCDRCHATAWAGGSYAGTAGYLGSSHGTDPRGVWPGPAPPPRTEAGAAGKCLNCHEPHGLLDATGEIPVLALAREEALCLACHDGAPASSNIGADLAKPFRHPIATWAGRHQGPTESQPADFATLPVDRRHVECADCHNPHLGTADPGGPPPAPDLSRVNLGVSRVRVQNGPAGTAPTYTFTAGSDTLSAPVAEYQLCFKCHSSWTTQPTGQTNLAFQLNPANASYHPVEAVGRDVTIAPEAFVTGWSAASLTRCGDCHGSDFEGGPRGPHGSIYRHILKRPYTASSLPRIATADELCFSCHAFDVYANPAAPEPLRAASRFNGPGAVQGHAEHVGAGSVPCYACHVTHGSPTRAHLIVTGRTPGIAAFSETATGGTCQATCHEARSYTTNYPR